MYARLNQCFLKIVILEIVELNNIIYSVQHYKLRKKYEKI